MTLVRCRFVGFLAVACAVLANAALGASPQVSSQAAAPSTAIDLTPVEQPRELWAAPGEPATPLRRLPPVEPVLQTSYRQAGPADQDDDESDDNFGMLGQEFKDFIDQQKNPIGFPPGKPSIVIGGQVQTDAVCFGQDEVSRQSVGDLQDAADFRRARIVMQGISHEVYRWVFAVDFALAGRPSFLDMFIEHTHLPVLQNARVGHFFEPFSLERVTQNRSTMFMERSLVDTFAPARSLGAMTNGHLESERGTWQIGTFRTGTNDFGNDSFDSGQALTMRGTCLPYWDEPSDGRYYVHLGACYSFRDTYQDQVRFENSPEIRIEEPGAPNNFGPIFVDTGNIPASHFQLFDAEFAWINGPFSVQSEYACTTVNQIGGPNLFFDGLRVQLGYFLTGEHRPYDRRMGIHQRIVPFSNFFRVRTEGSGICMGTGGWELAVRYSRIKLNDENILGNNLQDFTFGVNWYWNAYARLRFNYIRAYLDDVAFGRSVTNIYGMRMDFEF